MMMVKEPLGPSVAKALLVDILENGKVDISPHAWTEMQADGITIQDVFQVLRGGIVEPAESQRGTWRYRVRQGRRFVVVSFNSEVWSVVVTVWRKTK
jgi:hypothetical protein